MRIMNYTLQFPFEISPGREISGCDKDFDFTLLGYPATITMKGKRYIIKLSSIQSKDLAAELTPRLWTGLAWLLVNLDIGFIANIDPLDVIAVKDPQQVGENIARTLGHSKSERINGWARPESPSIFLSDQNIWSVDLGETNVIISPPIEMVSMCLDTGVSATNSAEITSDLRLRTALDLYSSSFYEYSGQARLLILTMVLETLTFPIRKPEIALTFIDKWNREIEEVIKSTREGTKEHLGLVSLQRELCFRRDLSIRSQVRSMVESTLENSGHNDAKSVAQMAIDVYDVRSELIHEGLLTDQELGEACMNARKVVKLVLEARFKGIQRSWESGT